LRGLFCTVVLMALAAAPASSSTILYQGIFGDDSQVQEFTFTVASATTVTLQTYGYAGGTVNSVTIPGGGFAPSLAFFSPLTPNSPVLYNAAGFGSPVNPDSYTGNYEDAYVQLSVDPGTYTLALMVYDNSPTGGPNDPFAQDGNPGFTCVEAGVSGSFCDLESGLGNSRTGDWALSITGADSAVELPEPGALFLAAIGAAFFVLMARRRLFDWRIR
jgi:hypothetical protein